MLSFSKDFEILPEKASEWRKMDGFDCPLPTAELANSKFGVLGNGQTVFGFGRTVAASLHQHSKE
jgi:hypothetical protein